MEAADDLEDDEESIEEGDSEDTEADENAWPKGSAPRGRGQPLQVGSFEKRREIGGRSGPMQLGQVATCAASGAIVRAHQKDQNGLDARTVWMAIGPGPGHQVPLRETGKW